jgi:hypothetical protein
MIIILLHKLSYNRYFSLALCLNNQPILRIRKCAIDKVPVIIPTYRNVTITKSGLNSTKLNSSADAMPIID